MHDFRAYFDTVDIYIHTLYKKYINLGRAERGFYSLSFFFNNKKIK